MSTIRLDRDWTGTALPYDRLKRCQWVQMCLSVALLSSEIAVVSGCGIVYFDSDEDHAGYWNGTLDGLPIVIYPLLGNRAVAMASSNLAFVVRIGLKSPIIPGRRLMLDALLSGLLFARTGDPAGGSGSADVAIWTRSEDCLRMFRRSGRSVHPDSVLSAGIDRH